MCYLQVCLRAFLDLLQFVSFYSMNVLLASLSQDVNGPYAYLCQGIIGPLASLSQGIAGPLQSPKVKITLMQTCIRIVMAPGQKISILQQEHIAI